MTINVNNEIWFGIDVQHKNNRGKIIDREFQRIAITNSKESFIEVAQYILDSAPDTSRIVIIYKPTDHVIDFTGLVKQIGLKSKRYNLEAN